MSQNKLPDLTKETDYRELLRTAKFVTNLLASSEFSSANYYKQDNITCSVKEKKCNLYPVLTILGTESCVPPISASGSQNIKLTETLIDKNLEG